MDRSWAFKQRRKGLLTTATGSHPILVSIDELARLREHCRRRPHRAVIKSAPATSVETKAARRSRATGR